MNWPKGVESVIATTIGAAKSIGALLRRFVLRGVRRNVLVLGDSHVRVFEHAIFFLAFPDTRLEVVHSKGGSAIGILNPRSTSGARRMFADALDGGDWDLVMIGLGEVDTAYALWRQAEYHGVPVVKMFERSIAAYLQYLEELRSRYPLVVIGATYPTLGEIPETTDPVLAQRKLVHASQRQRTELALEFNRRIGAWCAEHGVPHLDTATEALGPDGLVRETWKVRRRLDHHYAKGPYARWMVRVLRPILR